MGLWDTLSSLIEHEATHLERLLVPLDHISPPVGGSSALAAGEGYFRLWVVQMFLKSDREWFTKWYPVVQSLTTFRFGNQPTAVEIAQVAGPGYLHNIDPDNLDRVVQVDYPLTPLVPFGGGTVRVEAGLVAMPADDLLRRFLDVMGGFASLLSVPQLSGALGLTSAVSRGVESLLGVSGKHLVLGYQQTFVGAGGEGASVLAPTHVVLLNAPRGSYASEQMWVKDSGLLVGGDAMRASPLTGVDYLLLRLETCSSRDDWDALTSISDSWTRAIGALSQIGPGGEPRLAEAEGYIRAACVAALNSPDLCNRDRMQIARALRDRYASYKAALGIDGGDRGGFELPGRPTFADVAGGASGLDATPITLGQLFDY